MSGSIGVGPRHDLRIRPVSADSPEELRGLHVLCQRLRDGREIPLTAPADYATTAAEWRTRCRAIAPDRVRGSIGDWTEWHRQGLCAGDVAGCPHCGAIAELGDRANGYDRMVVLANRRNLPHGIGNYVAYDDDIERRVRLLRSRALDREGGDA